jgi:sarcosine oxidase subunit gamma
MSTRLAAAPEPLGLSVLEASSRAGLKGPNAAGWLEGEGVPVPAQPNTWLPLPGGGLVARLATSEFLVEDGRRALAARLRDALGHGAPGVYPVLRCDASFALAGAGAIEVLAQVCNVQFAALDLSTRPLVLTSMVGVSVLVVPQWHGTAPRYRIWCDPTFGPYLSRTLLDIVTQEGGTRVAPARLEPDTLNDWGDP